MTSLPFSCPLSCSPTSFFSLILFVCVCAYWELERENTIWKVPPLSDGLGRHCSVQGRDWDSPVPSGTVPRVRMCAYASQRVPALFISCDYCVMRLSSQKCFFFCWKDTILTIYASLGTLATLDFGLFKAFQLLYESFRICPSLFCFQATGMNE